MPAEHPAPGVPEVPRTPAAPSGFAFDRVLVCGIGLIGSSVARALRRMHREGGAGGAGVIVAADPHAAGLARALALGVIDEACVLAPARAGEVAETDAAFARAVAQADLIILAAPVAQTHELLARIAPVLRADAVLTDVGSTKGQICEAAHAMLGARRARFVAAHPIAGGEASGVDAGDAALFDGRDVILCPAPDAAPDAVTRVEAMWRLAGARTTCMTPAQHDQLFAGVSHLPHLLAFTFIEHILQSEGADERLAFAGPGFRDFTRIAASNPQMWRDICLANRDAVLADLDRYLAVLGDVRATLADANGDALEALFSRSRAARRDWRAGTTCVAGSGAADAVAATAGSAATNAATNAAMSAAVNEVVNEVVNEASTAVEKPAKRSGNRYDTAADALSTAGKTIKKRNI
ncbi:MAG: prephenate dehydrogenase [Janthinobacterium lividum]